jgi:hypothetical protein
MTPYNPLDKLYLAESVVRALLDRTLDPLPPAEAFEGAGIYAIYYRGDFPAYARIARREVDTPVYVGKAVTAGARRGGFGLGCAPGRVLHRRLVEHAKSISQAANLRLEDFRCRYLVVEDIWIPLGEQLLIQKFGPIWNRLVNGFGIHEPGGGRHKQRRSAWDVIHPGRALAARLQENPRTAEEILSEISRFLAQQYPDR